MVKVTNRCRIISEHLTQNIFEQHPGMRYSETIMNIFRVFLLQLSYFKRWDHLDVPDMMSVIVNVMVRQRGISSSSWELPLRTHRPQ